MFIGVYAANVTKVNINGLASFAALENGKLLLGTQLSVAGFKTEVPTSINSVSSIAGYVGSGLLPTIVDYSIIRGTFQRSGSIKMANDGINVIFEDDYVENDDTGVKLTPVISGNLLAISYTTTSTAASPGILNLSSRVLI
jgi:hypothetical protein